MTDITYALIDTAGTSHALNSTTGVYVSQDVKGFGMPPIDVTSSKYVFAPGGRLKRVVTDLKEIDIPLFIQAATPSAIESLMDTVRGWFLPGTEDDTSPSTVTFQVTRIDGSSREIDGVYVGGLEGDFSADASGDTWCDVTVTLRAPDAYWRATTDSTLDVTRGDGISTWFPYWPYDLSSSSAFADTTITNAGQVEAWPIWTITGPGTSVTLTNSTTGKTVEVAVTLAAGETLTIDTRPGYKTVRDQDDVNRFGDLTSDSELWALKAGANDVLISLADADSNSLVELAYRARYGGVLR